MKALKQLPVLSIVLALFIFQGCKTDDKNEQSKNEVSENVDKTQLRHVVLFKFKDTASSEDIDLVIKEFKDLKAKIPQIRQFEWGVNNSPEGLHKGFTHCFILTFDNESGRDAYLPHPEHKAFGGIVSPYIADVLVVDYLNK